MSNPTINALQAHVKAIHNYDGVNLVEFDFDETILSMMSLELTPEIQIGTRVTLGVKPSHVTIAKSYNLEISYSNRIKTRVVDIIEGAFLCTVLMSCEDTIIESLITKKSMQNMHLKKGDKVVTLIKSSELVIKEVHHE